jgi:cell division septum initiation protein DivIVA
VSEHFVASHRDELLGENKELKERIKRLEDRIHRAAMAFFRDGSDGQVASGMLAILEEERGKK